MLRTLTIPAAAVIAAAAIAFAQDKTEPEEKGCDGSTVEMVECLAGKAAQWDKRLNAAYQKLLKLVEGKQRNQLRAAQRLWVQYRDANCLYWALGEGTIARLESADCNYRLTKERAEELEGATER